MIRLRWGVQLAMLALFLALAAVAAWPLKSPIIPSAWLVADPLVALVAIASAKAVWELAAWALVLVAATMLVGRFFCGWACPLGTTLDLGDRYLWRRRASSIDDEIRPRGRWKHYVLAVILASAVFGVSTGLAFDPLVLMTRTVETVLVPFVSWLGLGSVRAARLLPGHAALSVPALETPVVYGWMTATTLILLGIIFLGRVERRFWCRNLCPLGALLGWMSRTGLVKRHVEGDCTSCGRCARGCPMGAIPAKDFVATHRGECVLCLNCREVCRAGTVRFGPNGARPAPGFVPDRRQALAAIGAGIGVGLLGAGSVRARPRPGNIIRPPGALPEDEFLSRCTRCMACAQACPTNGLQALGLEAGWEALWTPVLLPVRGGCEAPCWNCTQVCPTGAIRKLTHEEKSFAKIGTARVFRERCLAWEQVKACLVCDEVCPYDAIDFLTITDYRGTQRRPVVHAEKCVGCGICEHECPVREPRAIVVEHYGEERLRSGSYITPAKRQMRVVGDDRGVDYLREQRESAPAPPSDGAGAGVASPPEEEPLPPGFIVK